jgi:hypothetical protein
VLLVKYLVEERNAGVDEIEIRCLGLGNNVTYREASADDGYIEALSLSHDVQPRGETVARNGSCRSISLFL